MVPKRRRRRYHGLYYHSSPPKIFSMNGNPLQNGHGKYGRDDSKDGFVVKPSNIRIWIHDKDVGKLTRVLWAGQGNRLRSETSTNARVRRFLENVPPVMNVIKNVHQAVVDNNLETLQALLEEPPPSLVTTKDSNGLTVMHKAAGFGYATILEYLIQIWPNGISVIDSTGKTPLHWAAGAKNNLRCYTVLVDAGGDEEALDYRMKTPSYYKAKPNDIDRSFLSVVPDAPRVHQDNSTDWTALVDDIGNLSNEVPTIKTTISRRGSDVVGNGLNLLTTRSRISSIENISEPEFYDGDDNLINDTASTVEANNDSVEKNDDDENVLQKTESPSPSPTNDDDNNNNKNDVPKNNEDDDLNGNIIDDEHEDDDDDTINKEENKKNDDNDDDGNDDDVKEPENEQNEIDNDQLVDNINDEDNNDTEEHEIVENVNDDINKKNSNDLPAGFSSQYIGMLSPAKENVSDINDKEKNDEVNDDDETKEGDQEGEKEVEQEGEKEVEQEGEKEVENEDEKEDEKEVETNEETEKVVEDEKQDETNEETKKVAEDEDENTQNEKDNQEKNLHEEDNEENEEGNDEKTQENSEIDNKDEAVDEENSIKNDEELELNTNDDDVKVDDNEQNNFGIKTDQTEEINDKIEEIKKIYIDDDDDDDDQNSEESQIVIGKIDNDDEKHNNLMKQMSPSTALEIEGLVQGEPDDNQVQSQSAEIDDESKIKSIIESGDMEQLALLVLNGDGKTLIGLKSSQPEIQAFLDNVPAYMNKIRRVHQAAKEGNIRELQSALDRRKFAIAKDELSPKGATPLHVATIFGHAGIVRYLAGRFPETTSAVDENGRTALHYAATVSDNGHFYNLLTHFGSNPKAMDKLGNIPDFYKHQDQSNEILTHKQLLKYFGANETFEKEMLNDQVPDDVHSSRRVLDDEDVLSTLERCYRLIHDPITGITLETVVAKNRGSASSLRVSVTSYMARFLKRSIFDKIKKRQTKLDHNLFDVIWPAMKKSSKERRIDEDLSGGVVAPDFDVYVVFQEFMVPLIKDMHCMNLSQEFKPHPRLFYFPMADGHQNDEINYNIDDTGKYVTDGFVECSRNLDDFELPLNLNIGQIEHAERILIEKILTTEFAQAIGEIEAGTYYTMNEVLENPSEICTILTASKLLVPLLDSNDVHQEAESIAINGQYWPYGRGVFISYSGDLAAWINVQDHLRIIVGSPSNLPANIGFAYSKVGRAITFLEERLHFRESYFLGYLSSRPTFLGTSLKISTLAVLPNLIKEIENLRHLCIVRGLNMIPNVKNDTVRLVNMQSLGLTEWHLLQDYCTAVTNILQLEKDMSLTNSKQIAAMLVKIFRRKKNSLNDG